jgi:hypothetical protein
MSAPQSLKDCYKEDLADLWSANDHMYKVVRDLADIDVRDVMIVAQIYEADSNMSDLAERSVNLSAK